MTQVHHPARRSPRLEGYDYGEEGAYFVTICTSGRRCLLGEVVEGVMRLSEMGAAVRDCWTALPEHFPHTRTHAFQIMPNHVHGVVEILTRVGTRHAVSLHVTPVGAQHAAPVQDDLGVVQDAAVTQRGDAGGHTAAAQHLPTPGSLSTIIRSFKSASTKLAHERHSLADRVLWQRSFHDRIIRDRREWFFIERYIELNPLLWHCDRENPQPSQRTPDELRHILMTRHGLDAYAVEYVLNHLEI